MKKFENPEIEIDEFMITDVITTSPVQGCPQESDLMSVL